MSTVITKPGAATPEVVDTEPRHSLGRRIVNVVTSTDHKVIGYMYLVTSFLFFCVAGVMALIIRAELFSPGIQVVQSHSQFNQLFTMHGTIMLLLFATPLFAGFADAVMPQIGRASCRARDWNPVGDGTY